MGESGNRTTVLSSDPSVMGGTTVFAGTRVPVQTLLDYIEGNENLETFLTDFPSVPREQAIAFLENAAQVYIAQQKAG